jgi:proline dehydrogenase
VLRQVLLTASRSAEVRRAIETAPFTRDVVRRFVAGQDVDAALRVARTLADQGLNVSLDYLGENTRDRAQADATREACVKLLNRLAAAGLTGSAEVSLKLSALGQTLPKDGPRIALDHAWKICAAAAQYGTTITLDMEAHTTTDATLAVLAELRGDFPWVGAVLQAYLHRTEDDCRRLAYAGSRVRLCKGAYHEPGTVAFQNPHDVDLAYVRCLKVLMAGQGYPMVASHDPRLIEIAGVLAARADRAPGTYEYQMLYGVRPNEQRRLAAAGEKVRVYVPYGDEWYGYLMRRLAERPANLAFFARAVMTRG